MKKSLSTLVVTLIQKKLEEGALVALFARSVFRGKLTSISHLPVCWPALTYGYATDENGEKVPEECISLNFIPGPRDRKKVQDIAKYKFTRNEQSFIVPVRALGGLSLAKLEDGLWMASINTAVKN